MLAGSGVAGARSDARHPHIGSPLMKLAPPPAYGEPMLVNNCVDSRISAPVVDMGGVRLNPSRPATAPTSHVLTVDGVVSRTVDGDVIREPRIVSFEAAVATELTPPRRRSNPTSAPSIRRAGAASTSCAWKRRTGWTRGGSCWSNDSTMNGTNPHSCPPPA